MDLERRQRERKTRGDPEDAAARRSFETSRLRSAAADPSSRLNVTDLDFARDGRLLVATRGNLEWRSDKGILLETWLAPRGFRNAHRRVAISADGASVVVSNWGAPLAILDREGQVRHRRRRGRTRILRRPGLRAVELTEEVPGQDPVHAFRFEADGALLVMLRDGSLHRVDVTSGRSRGLGSWELGGIEQLTTAVISSRRQEALAMGLRPSEDFSGPIQRYLWGLRRSSALAIPEDELGTESSTVLAAALSPEDDALAIGNKLGVTALLRLAGDGRVHDVLAFEAPMPGPAPLLKGPGRSIALAFHRQRNELAAVNVAGDLTVYEALSGEVLRHSPGCFPRGYPNDSRHWLHRAELTVEPEGSSGVLFVRHRNPSGPTRELEAGDRVLALNDEPATSVLGLRAAVDAAPRMSRVVVEREGAKRSFEIDLDLSSYT